MKQFALFICFSKKRLPARSAFGTTGLAFGARAEVEFWTTIK